MKTKSIVGAIIILVALCSLSMAQQWREDRFDARWIPITDKEMEHQVRTNAQDVVALYRLWFRASYQHKYQPYFSALQKLRKEQPQNGKVLATYCAVLMNSNVSYGFGQFKFRVNPKEGSIESIGRNLEKAKVLEPDLWLIYTTDAYVKSSSNGNRVEGAEDAVKLCRKALELAPDLSFTNMEMGYALSNLAMTKKTGYSEAARYYKRAQRLSPVDCGSSFLLLNVYRFYTPNKAEAQKAGQAVLSTIPPNVKLTPRLRQFLTKQGITVPKS